MIRYCNQTERKRVLPFLHRQALSLPTPLPSSGSSFGSLNNGMIIPITPVLEPAEENEGNRTEEE